jgi:hypothetical protein
VKNKHGSMAVSRIQRAGVCIDREIAAPTFCGLNRARSDDLSAQRAFEVHPIALQIPRCRIQ